MNHNPIRLINRKTRTKTSSLNLHPLTINNLARRNGLFKHHTAFRTAIENDRFELASDLNRDIFAFVNVHLLLWVGDGDLANSTLARLLGLILNDPFAAPILVFAFGRTQWFFGAEFWSSGRFVCGGRRLCGSRVAALLFVFLSPSLLIPRHLFETRCGGGSIARLFLFQFGEYTSRAATGSSRIFRPWYRFCFLLGTPALANRGL
mmetsp:Transcript_22141/g.48162  ORF Transcript_22141/g.48162 Transcript_22141/m.48162 type:complete len:206 (-) Transcript_22141:814-1431(-)